MTTGRMRGRRVLVEALDHIRSIRRSVRGMARWPPQTRVSSRTFDSGINAFQTHSSRHELASLGPYRRSALTRLSLHASSEETPEASDRAERQVLCIASVAEQGPSAWAMPADRRVSIAAGHGGTLALSLVKAPVRKDRQTAGAVARYWKRSIRSSQPGTSITGSSQGRPLQYSRSAHPPRNTTSRPPGRPC